MKLNRIAAVFVWIVGVIFTIQFFASVGELSLLIAAPLALGTQAVLTIGEAPLWRFLFRRDNPKITLFAAGFTLVDGGLNAGGIYPSIPRLINSSVGKMMIKTFQLTPSIEPLFAFGIAMFIGTIIAGGAEYLWGLD